MNIQQLRHTLKVKWLLYYRQNRPWLTKLRIWGTIEGQRRPSSSFILATVANLEPQLVQVLPFIVALSNNPDQIVAALGLNFNPEEELKLLTKAEPVVEVNSNGNGSPLSTDVGINNGNGNGVAQPLLPKLSNGIVSPPTGASNLPSWVDETCKGVGWNESATPER